MIELFARHRTAANLLMGLLVLLGLVVLPTMLRETFPDITAQQVEVRVVYPGASSTEIEESVCQRIEDAVDGIQYVREVTSEAREGLAIVKIEMEDGGDIIVFKDEVSTELDAIANELPDDAEDPTIRQLGLTTPVLSVLVTGDMSVVDLKAYCEDLKRRMQLSDGISLVEVSGFSDHQFRVELSTESLQRFGLSVQDVANTISAQNITSPAGGIESADGEMLIRLVEQKRSALELENLVIIETIAGAEIRLGDLGSVIDIFEADEEKVLLRDVRAGKLIVKKTKQEDQIRVAEAAKAFLEQERQRQPKLTLFVSGDGSSLVRERIALVLTNGWQGMLLVFVTLTIFFNWRLSFWVAASLPVSFIGAIFFMPMFGLTINMMTLVGMLLGIGILMDDGIVIAENIAAHRSRGKAAMQAAIDGVKEVQVGVFSSFITTVCVLGPLAFISGDIGKVLAAIPIMLILVLAVSLIEAYAILPSHLGHSLHHDDPDNPAQLRAKFDRLFNHFRDKQFGGLVDLAIKWRYLFVGSVIGLMMASIALIAGGFIQFVVFPAQEGDTLAAKMTLPAGTPLARTEQIVQQVVAGLEAVNEELSHLQNDGQPLVESYNIEFGKNSEAFESGPHVATINVDLLGSEFRSISLDDVIGKWKAKVGSPPDLVAFSVAQTQLGPAGRAIEVRIKGQDLSETKLAAKEVIDWFNQFRGVRNVSDDLRKGKPEIRVSLKSGALAKGLNASSVAGQLRAAFQGVTADEIQIGNESYEIDVRLARAEQDSLADLDYFQFVLPDGNQVPLDAIAKIDRGRGWSRIARVNGQRAVTVLGDVDANVVSGSDLVAKFRAEFADELQQKYPGIQFDFEGESAEGNKTLNSMITAMGIGLVGVFVLLSFQFGSYIEPLIVMLAIPLSLIGVFVGHWLIGIDLSLPSMLGFVSLSGIVVNDSILLVTFLKKEVEAGADIYESAGLASRKRFRAILLTSATTIAGLLPLMFETSQQAQVLIPLAVSISFGILASTILVLIVIPSTYAILADVGLFSSMQSVEGTEGQTDQDKNEG
ncbi:MAG: efflux RND transporter permease subunit [Planctomycetota bacterium]